MVHIIRNKADSKQLEEMLQELNPIIKIAVDTNREILAGGGPMHADCEAVLLEDGSSQDSIWGANWIPSTQTIEFEALINIRPHQNNRAMTIQNQEIQDQVENITRALLGGIQ